MARPRQYDEDRVTTAVRIPPSVHERFRELADERDVSVNYLINKAMVLYLNQLGEDREPTVASA
jgi:predicted HicB family RNase H-like nuclease